MKKFYALILLFCVLLLSGCDRRKPVIVLNSKVLTKENVNEMPRRFPAGKPLYYAVLTPKEFKDDVLRIQVMKKDEKTAYWGYSISYSVNALVDNSRQYCKGYFVPYEKGYFIMRAFEMRDLEKAAATIDFWVY